MSAYLYTGTDDRYYPGIGREVRPGDTVEWTSEPEDGRWAPVSAPVPDPVPAPVPDPVPAVPAPVVTPEVSA